jgi:integrase
MPSARLTKRAVSLAQPSLQRYTIFDTDLKGFGLRVSPSGRKSWIVEYRVGHGGRRATKQRLTVGDAGTFTPEEARDEARTLLARIRLGGDPVSEKRAQRASLTLADLSVKFLSEHASFKRKARTFELYSDMLNRIVLPFLGNLKAHEVSRSDVTKLHLHCSRTPVQANRLLIVISSVYAFGARAGLVPEAMNPARSVEKYPEKSRERYLSADELQRLGHAIREAETVGIEWTPDDTKPKSKHAPKRPDCRRTTISPHAAAALRLLIFTGARLREILHLKWQYVDLERGLLLLPDSKTGRKTIILNAMALAVLQDLSRMSDYVIAGDVQDRPRSDLKRPWRLISKRAGLEGVRLHDLRHTFASFGAGGGLGLPIIGKLLGHSQVSTTQRYAHLDNDPLRRASNSIGTTIAAAMGEA